MKFVEVVEEPTQEPEKLECPNCGGELKHRTQKPDGWMKNHDGEVMNLYLPTDDYICEKCGKVYKEDGDAD